MNVEVYLPGNVRAQDVASVLGKLCGNDHDWRAMGSTRWVEVHRTLVKATVCLEMLSIETYRAEKQYQFSYHFESCAAGPDGHAGRVVSLGPPAAVTAHLGEGLCRFFGGHLYLQGRQDSPVLVVGARPDEENSPGGDAAWAALQERIAAVQAVV